MQGYRAVAATWETTPACLRMRTRKMLRAAATLPTLLKTTAFASVGLAGADVVLHLKHCAPPRPVDLECVVVREKHARPWARPWISASSAGGSVSAAASSTRLFSARFLPLSSPFQARRLRTRIDQRVARVAQLLRRTALEVVDRAADLPVQPLPRLFQLGLCAFRSVHVTFSGRVFARSATSS